MRTFVLVEKCVQNIR